MTSKALNGLGRSNLNFVDGYINGSQNRRQIRFTNGSTNGATLNAMRGTTATQIVQIVQNNPVGLAVSRSGGIASASHPIVCLASSSSPYLVARSYPGGNTLTNYSLSTGIPNVAHDVDITDPPTYTTDARYIAVAHQANPLITVYKATVGSSTLTKLTNPATLPTGVAYGCAWNRAGTVLAVRHANSPFLSVYTRSGDTLTKVANPATLPVAPDTNSQTTNKRVSWNASGDRLILTGTGNRTEVYSWDGTTLTQVYSNTTGTYEVAQFHPTIDEAVALMLSSGNLAIGYYNKTNNTLTQGSTAIISGAGAGRDLVWHPNGTILTHLANQSTQARDFQFRYQNGAASATALTAIGSTYTALSNGAWLVY
jgi:hypothetical protein